jgi:hypothetical protein
LAKDVKYKVNLEKILKSDIGYIYFKNIRTSLDYLQQNKKNGFAMIRQLGLPTFFITFTSENHCWDPLVAIVSNLHRKRKRKKETDTLENNDIDYLIRKDPVTCTHYYTRSKEDHYVYFKLIGDHLIYLVLYVDDMLLIGNNKEIIQDVKTQLSSKFDMKDLGAANFILGMEIKRDWEKMKLWLNQRKYVEKILQRFNMQECKLVKVPIPVGVKLYADQFPKT